MTRAVVLVAHGTVDDLRDLPAFLANIRHGHTAPEALVTELRQRYEAIGGGSPLNAINARLARKLEAALGVPVRLANRLWAPYPKEVLAALEAQSNVEAIVALPLAQHSAHVYAEAVASAATVPVHAIENWGRTAALLDAFARRIREAYAKLPAEAGAVAAAAAAGAAPGAPSKVALVLSAHSLPQAVIDAGDPYEHEVRQSAAGVAERVRDVLPEVSVAFQSQGMSLGPAGKPMPWLGPDLPATFDALAGRGFEHVIVAPIGFLADHVEILYDIDIEAKRLAHERGLSLTRTASLDDADDFVAILADLVRPRLAATAGRDDVGGEA